MKIGDLCPHCEDGELTLDSPNNNILKCWKCGFRHYPDYASNKPGTKGIPFTFEKQSVLRGGEN